MAELSRFNSLNVISLSAVVGEPKQEGNVNENVLIN